MSIESKTTNGRSQYRGVPQVKGKKQHTRWVSTRAEASMLEAELKMSMGGQVARTGHTVGSVVSGYIESRAGAGRSPATIEFYQVGERAIPQTFSDRLVADVNPVLVDSLYRELTKGGASPHKVRKVHSTLSASFGQAMKYGWMASNPCASADKPKAKAEEITPPEPAEVKRIVAAATMQNADLGACFRLAAVSGMRRSELVGLQWRDLSGTQIIVRRNRVQSGKVWITRDTKSGNRSHRTINLDAETLAALEEVRERAATADRTHPWIFARAGMEPWTPEYLTNTYQRLRLDGSSFHSLRHFHATQLLAAGVPVTQVSARLGHSSPAMTLSAYAHWIPAKDQASADIIAATLA
jgi:integrase